MMNEEIHQQFFPTQLPSGILVRSLDKAAAQESIKTINHLIFAPGFKEALGLFETPQARREKFEHLQKMHVEPYPEWIVFYNLQDEPIGWFYGYLKDEDTFFIDTIGFIPAFRGQGIYRAFLRHLIAYLRVLGYERLTTSHHPNNRAALIADLKMGFTIVGLELHESLGPSVKMAYPLHEDRRQAFERVFSMERESINSADPMASTG